MKILNSVLALYPFVFCAGSDGIDDLFGHCFFSTIDWEKLKAKKQDPPFKPTVVSDEAFHFDSTFTSKTPKGNNTIPKH